MFVFGQNIPEDSISYAFFYKKELKLIVQKKKELRQKGFDVIKQLEIADLYDKINCEDSAYSTYYKVFEKEFQKRTLSNERYNELLFQLHYLESSKHNYTKDRRFFLKLLLQNTKNDNSDQWYAKIENENFKDLFGDSLNYDVAYDKIIDIQKTYFFKTNTEFRTIILQNLGNFYTSINKFERSEATLNNCLQLAKQNKDYLSQVCALINLSVNESARGNFSKALYYLKQTDSIPKENYQIKILRIIAKQKQLANEALKNKEEAKTQEKLFLKLDSLINDFAKNSNFYEIDVKFQTKEKDAKINKLNNLESRFVRNKIIFGFLIFMVFLLALYSFLRWKKSDYNKKKLLLEKQKVELLKDVVEKEKNTVIEELKTVKRLVIEDYLMLKNNKKVYLTELEYIRAEGHYLEIYTKNKKEVIRGTIGEILKQLPPNFAQTHRSYIVNKNFISASNTTEIVLKSKAIIPLSRKYKNAL
jgi:hypothetical protein